MNQKFHLNPKDINQPIQLLGASLIGAVFLVGEFLYISTKIQNQVMAWCYGITAMLIFPMILVFIFILQTKFRAEMLSDHYYAKVQGKKYQDEIEKGTIKLKMGDVEKWLKQK